MELITEFSSISLERLKSAEKEDRRIKEDQGKGRKENWVDARLDVISQ
jgi:hypothetical protein